MKGKLYGVGVGSGDPELLTLKAVRIIKDSRFIAVPNSGSEEQLAFSICSEYIENKTILSCAAPMTKDKQKLEKAYKENVVLICEILDRGEDVAFLTLGDPTVYSTYMYIHKLVGKQGYKTEIIPGITSFCAAAASLNISLCERDQPLHIIPASYEKVEDFAKLEGTKVFMKSGKKLNKLLATLGENQMLENSYLVERCGLDGERKQENLVDFKENSGYFTIVITKEEK